MFRETTRGRHAGISAAGKEASCRLGTILLAQDMHTRPEDLTNLMAKAEMELRRTTAQRRATTYMFVASIAAAVSRSRGHRGLCRLPWRMIGVKKAPPRRG